jgi:hypothetical protein
LTVGLLAPNLTVTLRNIGTQPLVLRGVRWGNYRHDKRDWVRRLYGSTVEKPEGTIVHDKLAQQLTQVEFEAGLMLPGAARTVSVPLTPQRDGVPELWVGYKEVPGADWMKRVFLPDGNDPLRTTYRPATDELVAQYLKQPGQDAVVRFTPPPQGPTVPVQRMIFPVQLPLASDATFARTGGMSYIESSRKAGLDPDKDTFWSFYRPPLQSWFFTKENRRAVALRKVPEPNPTVPPTAPPGTKPKDYRWDRVPLPLMDTFAPDEFCRAQDGATPMLLRPAAFAGILTVNLPYTDMYYYPGQTPVPLDVLWPVLARALERKLEVKLVPINPNGLSVQEVLTAGVEVDAGGRWLK